jgi:hypothetical protein
MPINQGGKWTAVPVEKFPVFGPESRVRTRGSSGSRQFPIGIDWTGRAVCPTPVLPAGRDVIRGSSAGMPTSFGGSPSGRVRLVSLRPIFVPMQGSKRASARDLRAWLHCLQDSETGVILRAASMPNVCVRQDRRQAFRAPAGGVRTTSLLPLYQQWLKEGDGAYWTVLSTLIRNALAPAWDGLNASSSFIGATLRLACLTSWNPHRKEPRRGPRAWTEGGNRPPHRLGPSRFRDRMSSTALRLHRGPWRHREEGADAATTCGSRRAATRGGVLCRPDRGSDGDGMGTVA